MKLLKKPGFYISILLLIPLGALLVLLWNMNILSLTLYCLCVAISVIVWLITALCLCKKGIVFKIFGWILAVVLAVVSCFGTYYLWNTYDALKTISTTDKEQLNVAELYVLRTGVITDIQDLDGQTIGYLGDINAEGTAGIIAGLQEEGISFQTKEYSSSLKLVQDLKGMVIDAIILNQSYLAVVADYDGQEKIEDELVSIYSYSYVTEKTNESDNVDVTQTPFTVLISGIDTYGSISETSRSDVNLLLTVNPTTRTVLMISIPRDYYLTTVCEPDMGCANGEKDKLTHTGLHGIMTTEMTLEEAFGITINYNVRINFSSLIAIVNELGGITVNNPTAFDSRGYSFAAGEIELNGEEALVFSRERYSFVTGDRERGRNQMRVLEGIIQKVLSPAVLTNYTSILNTVSDSFQTNMPVEDMTALIKMQLSRGGSWNIYSFSVNGSDGNEYAYELGDNAYVMIPDEESMKHAADDVRAVENGETPPYKNN